MKRPMKSPDGRVTRREGRRAGARTGWSRALRVGGLVAVLALLVAVPALAAAVSSSTTYSDFAPNGAGGNNHWQNTNQSVLIAVVPDTDTTATAHFSANNGVAWMTQSASATGTASFTFVVSAEGANRIQYFGTDSTPTTETAKAPGYINIDKTKPATTPTGLATVTTQSDLADWSRDTTRTVTLVATDTVPSPGTATSGVHFVRHGVNAGSVETSQSAGVTFTLVKGIGGVIEGSNAVTYAAEDWAHNVETTSTGYVNIDTVEPTTTASPALAGSATTGWTGAPVEVTLNWTDASSGVMPANGTSYRLNGGNLTIYGVPFTIATEGSTKVTYRSRDRAGNLEVDRTGYVNIDTGNPTVTYTTSPSRSSGWYNKDVTVTLNGSDPVSGIAKTQYRLDEVTPEPWSDAVDNEFVILASENSKLWYDYQAVDNAGNVSELAGFQINMDSKAPKTYGKRVSGKKNRTIKLQYRINDNLSPKAQAVKIKIRNSRGNIVKYVQFSGKKTIGKWYKYSWKTSKAGTYRYYVYAKDLAGNSQSKAGLATIRVK